MSRLPTWLLSHWQWLLYPMMGGVAVALSIYLLTLRTVALIFFVAIWFSTLALGIGAGWAAMRLWFFRHHPLIRWVGVYVTAFIVDVLSAIILIFTARGVVLTWKFSSVLFISTFIGNILRAPLIFYLIRGPQPLTHPVQESSGELPPQYWLDAIRVIVREEVAVQFQKQGEPPSYDDQ